MLRTATSKRWGMAGLIALLLVALLMGCAIGSVSVPPLSVVRVLAVKLGLPSNAAPEDLAIIWSLRLPRVLMAGLVGAVLSMSGAALQGLFRNPLADPALIGVSGGAAAGAVAAVVLGGSLALIPGSAIVGALVATAVVYTIARTGARIQIETMLLAGLAVNALSGAIVGFLVQMAPYEKVRGVAFWLLGSMSSASWPVLGLVLLFSIVPMLWLPKQARALNALLLGDAEAFHLGFDVRSLKRRIVGMTAAMVGAAVAFCGTVGFVGLIVPHLARMLLGPDHRQLIPASALLGAVLMIIADLAARTVDAPNELPVGVLTALLGAPFFLYLIQSQKRRLF